MILVLNISSTAETRTVINNAWIKSVHYSKTTSAFPTFFMHTKSEMPSYILVPVQVICTYCYCYYCWNFSLLDSLWCHHLSLHFLGCHSGACLCWCFAALRHHLQTYFRLDLCHFGQIWAWKVHLVYVVVPSCWDQRYLWHNPWTFLVPSLPYYLKLQNKKIENHNYRYPVPWLHKRLVENATTSGKSAHLSLHLVVTTRIFTAL